MSIQEVSSDTPRFPSWKYDVFISYKGEDTRKNFTDHLYAALIQEGFNVFGNENELESGKAISFELLQAIKVSRISIIVFSRNYASSPWCLDELIKIVERMSIGRQMVVPIFYDVDPSMVRKQTGSFHEAFVKHEEAFKENIEKVQMWRTALIEVANLSGWNLNLTDRHPSEFIEEIVKDILRKLSHNRFWNFGDLVGIESCLEKFKMLIGARSTDVRIIGIHGMGGIGKTTITRVVYDNISWEFEGSCFLVNVGEISNKDGLLSLQKQLLSQILLGKDIDIMDLDHGINEIRKRLRHKKILVVIDDVVHIEQLNKLVGKHDWFGSGSRIIITTRDEQLLMDHGVDTLYRVGGLNYYESLQLFSLTAFRKRNPPEDYLNLSKRVVEYVGGLPLFLKVFGFFLFGKTIDEWERAVESLSRDSEKGILGELKISFDRLKEIEKEIVERKLNEALRKGDRSWKEANLHHMVTENMGCRLLSMFFLVLEAISVVLDLFGKSKQGFILAAFLLSAVGFIVTIYASILGRTTAAFRLQAERQLGWVEIVFSMVQLITTLLQFILTVLGVKKNCNASVLALAFSIIVVVFAFKKEKRVITQQQISNIQHSA